MLKPFAGKDIQPYYPTVLDIETSPNGEIIAIGFAYQNLEGERIYAYYDNTESWYREYCTTLLQFSGDKALSKRLRKLYAHNGANFDYLGLYEYFHSQNLILDGHYFMADSTGIGAVFTLENNVDVMMVDSFRMLPASLDALSKTFDVNHKKQEVPKDCKNDYLKFKNKYPELFREYLRNDVLGLQEILFKFWTRIYSLFGNVGELPMTLPSLALRIYSKSLDKPMMTPQDKKLKDLERLAYKGGLTLCMKTCEIEHINVYDVNSMYPAMMRDKRMPLSYKGYWTQTFNPNVIGIWKGTFIQDNHNVPPFMFDTKEGASYEGEGAYTTDEINHLLLIGGRFQLQEGYVYKDTGFPFRGFIGRVYDMRKQAQVSGDEALAYTLKIMMNSLYGKFAQRETGMDIMVALASKQRELVAEKVPFQLFGNFMAVPSERYVPHVFVGLATHITAYARVTLHTLMSNQINAGYFVAYCDTDSVHTTGVMPTSNELGDVKLEYSGKAVYAGRKIYAIITEDGKNKVKAKGIGRRTKQNLDYESIRKLVYDKALRIPYTFEVFPSVKEVLGERRKAAVMIERTRNLANTGGIWDE